MNNENYDLVKKAGTVLKERKLFIVTAESCTGGLLAKTLTDIPGSSEYFERGFITYSNIAKQELLGVNTESLEKFGAVSEEVAGEMAIGALKNSHAEVSVAVTGIAGPDGGSKDKPVGSVCFALACLDKTIKTFSMCFHGDRSSVRMQSVRFILKKICLL